MHELNALSPIDGRYFSETQELRDYFSEYSLIKYRLQIEIEYLISLSSVNQIPQSHLTQKNQKLLRSLYTSFTPEYAKRIKEIESSVNHDVKAVELFLSEVLENTPLDGYRSLIHFGLTSEDINNVAYTLGWKEAVEDILLQELGLLRNELLSLAREYASTPLLSMTHGQPATPTTLGKELRVFAERLNSEIYILASHTYSAKFSGATGTWSAHHFSIDSVDWQVFSKNFLQQFDLELNSHTTQIEPRDNLSFAYHACMRIASILTDMSVDMWLYISRGIFSQKSEVGHVGSSTMPHKINPIQFEKAEGNLYVARALLQCLSEKLPISRLQRDLSGSTLIRNQGCALAHLLIALQSISKGLDSISPSIMQIQQELNDHFEVLTEAAQSKLRLEGNSDAYDQLKTLSKGKKLDSEQYSDLLGSSILPEHLKSSLSNLSPKDYTGIASKLANQ